MFASPHSACLLTACGAAGQRPGCTLAPNTLCLTLPPSACAQVFFGTEAVVWTLAFPIVYGWHVSVSCHATGCYSLRQVDVTASEAVSQCLAGERWSLSAAVTRPIMQGSKSAYEIR